MKKLLFVVLMTATILGGHAQTPIIDPLLSEEMNCRAADEQIEIIVIMNSRYNREELNRRANYYVTKAERRDFVVQELKEFAAATQYDLKVTLSEMEGKGLVTEPHILWMPNAMSFSATKAAILDLAKRHDIEIIGYNMKRKWIPDEDDYRPAAPSSSITPNITQVHADEVWKLGNTGKGVVVAVIDSGVNYNHVDLADHLWDGGPEFPHHGYNFIENNDDPMDDRGHGTHCAGTVCGDGTSGYRSGVAPDATLMCVKCLDSKAYTEATIMCDGLQWSVEHGCDVISMSMGLRDSSITDRTLLRRTCEAVLDAGVIAAIAAGNDGDDLSSHPIPDNVCVPGSCPPPYLDRVQAENPGGASCSVCVGSVNYDNIAANSTGRGPVTWAETEFGDYPYNPGIGLIRPDVCAPGVGIISLDYLDEHGYKFDSGTSMATPCVAGCMCLMLSKCKDLTPSEICRILEETATPLTASKSNIYGFGLVNALAAVQDSHIGALSYHSFVLNDETGNNNNILNPGEAVTLDFALSNVSEIVVDGATALLTTDEPQVSITSNQADFGTFQAGETLTVKNAFAFSVTDEVEVGQFLKFTVEIQRNGEMATKTNFWIEVGGNILTFGNCVVINDDNGNGLLEPGETADLRVFVDNEGKELAHAVKGVLTSDCEAVTINTHEGTFGTIGAGLTAYADFNVSLDANVAKSQSIPFSLSLTDAAENETTLDFNCKNTCNIIIKLYDISNVGWNENYLELSYSDGTPSIHIPSSPDTTQYTMEVASGVHVNVTFHEMDYYAIFCSYALYHEDGRQIAMCFNTDSEFDVNCSGDPVPDFCEPASRLVAEPHDSNVTLTWEAPAESTPTCYEIYRETVLLATSTDLTYTDTDVAEGIYNYCVYAVYDECQSEYACTEVKVYYGVCENDFNLSIFPNPTSDKVAIECEGMTGIEVSSIDGRRILYSEFEGNSYQLNGLIPGIYTLRIFRGNESVIRKIVKL